MKLGSDETEDIGLRVAVRYGVSAAYHSAGRLGECLAVAEQGLGLARGDLDLGADRIGFSPCSIGEDSFQGLQRPREVNGQRASGLRFADARVQALLHALLLFVFLARGFSNKDLREQLAPLLGKRPGEIRPGRMTYDLRRLRLHGLIRRIPKTHRYRLTATGLRTALFYTRVYAHVLRPGLALVSPRTLDHHGQLSRAFQAAENAVNSWCDQAKIAA